MRNREELGKKSMIRVEKQCRERWKNNTSKAGGGISLSDQNLDPCTLVLQRLFFNHFPHISVYSKLANNRAQVDVLTSKALKQSASSKIRCGLRPEACIYFMQWRITLSPHFFHNP